MASVLILAATLGTDAHKPITSPFTFSADVRPILRQRCAACHVPGGVGPMSLLTHIDTVPWGESLRLELMSGHMPPWRVDRGAARVRTPGGLTARELNVLLTWVTGGTPAGLPTADDDPPLASGWTLGTPDAVLQLPRVTLGADEQDRTMDFVLPVEGTPRAIRAVELLPGTPAIVRSATIEAQAPVPNRAIQEERMLSLWVPGDEAVPLVGSGLMLPRGATLLVRVRYRKTWEYERREMADESRLGVYFTTAPAPAVRRVALAPGTAVTLPRATQALAVYPDLELSDVSVSVTAVHPGGRREELIAFQPRRGWARRYWFRAPIPLPRGTRLTVRVTPNSAALLPPGGIAPPVRRDRSTSRVFVNIVD